jgi:hypothetical protein
VLASWFEVVAFLELPKGNHGAEFAEQEIEQSEDCEGSDRDRKLNPRWPPSGSYGFSDIGKVVLGMASYDTGFATGATI